MLEKCRIIYKGDILTGWVYIATGAILLIFGLMAGLFAFGPGFKYLSYGMYIFCFYCIGKGVFMIYSYGKRYTFYLKLLAIDHHIFTDEINYTTYRIQKKNKNRRLYTYIVIFSTIAAFVGIFTQLRAFIMGTSIPIALISGIELSIGLLTGFRLNEFLRILSKEEKSF
ncbi:MAG: hypothetical protein J5I52_07785 [Saprospiraceae bacterium]|nr:MAG: hypothetical protein UZ09_BCD002001625 [Bacteroidetes bacterium OLB9]MCO6464034.1 hypothetical protein [Saprospiraceae bacterium]MCZ2338425.1 hypothetical protein [Chitinophagales bacterium]